MSLQFSKTWNIVILGLLIFGAVAFFRPGTSESALGQTGGFTWVAHSAHNSLLEKACPAGTSCHEWCFAGPDGVRPTGQTCCVDSSGSCIDP